MISQWKDYLPNIGPKRNKSVLNLGSWEDQGKVRGEETIVFFFLIRPDLTSPDWNRPD